MVMYRLCQLGEPPWAVVGLVGHYQNVSRTVCDETMQSTPNALPSQKLGQAGADLHRGARRVRGHGTPLALHRPGLRNRLRHRTPAALAR